MIAFIAPYIWVGAGLMVVSVGHHTSEDLIYGLIMGMFGAALKISCSIEAQTKEWK